MAVAVEFLRWLALCPPSAWYDGKVLLHTLQLYDWFWVGGGGGVVEFSVCFLLSSMVGRFTVVVAGFAVLTEGLMMAERPPSPPLRASIIRQRAKYSSSVGGFSLRGRLERFPLVHESRFRSTSSYFRPGVGAAAGEFKASSAIITIYFFTRKSRNYREREDIKLE